MCYFGPIAGSAGECLTIRVLRASIEGTQFAGGGKKAVFLRDGHDKPHASP